MVDRKISDEAAISLVFNDRVEAIKFAKEQMWDVVKWSLSLQVATVGLAAIVPGEGLLPLAAVPIGVGLAAAALTYYHEKWLGHGRDRLKKIRENMGETVAEIFSEKSSLKKGDFTVVYYFIISVSAIVSPILIYLLQLDDVRVPNAG